MICLRSSSFEQLNTAERWDDEAKLSFLCTNFSKPSKLLRKLAFFDYDCTMTELSKRFVYSLSSFPMSLSNDYILLIKPSQLLLFENGHAILTISEETISLCSDGNLMKFESRTLLALSTQTIIAHIITFHYNLSLISAQLRRSNLLLKLTFLADLLFPHVCKSTWLCRTKEVAVENRNEIWPMQAQHFFAGEIKNCLLLQLHNGSETRERSKRSLT